MGGNWCLVRGSGLVGDDVALFGGGVLSLLGRLLLACRG